MIEFNATILIQMINFFVFLFILKAIFFKPLIKSIEDRRNYISSLENEIKDKLKKFEDSEKKYQEELDIARKTAQDIINKNVTLAEEEKQNIVKSASNEAKAVFDSFKKELEEETSKAKKELSAEVDELAKDIAQKVLSVSK
ncbi:MAG: ATP synthase F0 subunit B [Candidatus Sericytochromatia bacterium]